MTIRLLLPLALAAGAATALPARQSTAGRAAGRFSLDMPAPEASATPLSVPAPAAADPSPPPVADGAAPMGGASVAYTLDTPIRDLIGNPATRAVLDRNLPGLSTDENLPKFDRLGLRAFQPLTGGQLTEAMLVEMAKDLAKIGGASLKAAPTRGGARASRNESR